MIRNVLRKALIAVTGLTVVLAVLIATGTLDRWRGDGTVSWIALWSLLTWWGLVSAVILVVLACIRRPREAALAAVSLGIMIGLTEITVRILDVKIAKPRLKSYRSSRYHHVYPPGAEMFVGRVGGASVIARTNDTGLRDDRSLEAFLEYDTRIVLLGDSFTLGLGVAQDSTVASVLESSLRERLGDDDIAVLNAGVVSYSPLLERQQYRGIIRRYRPTLVMLILDATDVGDDIRYGREIVPDRDPMEFIHGDQKPPRWRLAVAEMARPALRWIGANLNYPFVRFFGRRGIVYDYYDFKVEVAGVTARSRFFIYRFPIEDTRPFFDSTFASIEDIAANVAEDGATFVLVVTPRYHMWSGRECPDNWEVQQGQYTTDEPHQLEFVSYFTEAGERAGLHTLNLLPAFENTDRFPLVFRHDPHWNANGHAFVAEQLCDYILENKMIR
jgi:hypothetical protein